MTPRVIWYLILTVCDILVVVEMIINRLNKSIIDFNFYILIAAFLYWGYMMLSEMAASGESNKGTETFLGGERTQFMTDTLFKYIFSIVIGITLINGIFNYNNHLGQSIFIFLAFLYTNYLFPVACIAEIFLRNRNRSPAPLRDIIIILILLALSFLLQLIQNDFNFKTIGKIVEYICEAIGVLIAYFLYDFLVYIKIQGTWAGYTFLSSN